MTRIGNREEDVRAKVLCKSLYLQCGLVRRSRTY